MTKDITNPATKNSVGETISKENPQKKEDIKPAQPVESTRTPIKNAKAKTSLNLQGIFKPAIVGTPTEKAESSVEPVSNEVVLLERLTEVWNEFAEQRKSQVGEYQLLKKEFQFAHPVISISLTNPVEESFIENFRRELITFLRDRLKNSEITITTRLQETTEKRIIYTLKDKVDHLTGKNPHLNELKEKLGLDWDF